MHANERVIDIKALMRCLLEKWRFLLLVGVLLGAVLGGKNALDNYNISKQSLAQETQEETGISKSEELGMISDVLDKKNTYFVKSIRNKIDPFKEGRATADLIVQIQEDAVESGYAQSRSRVTSILNYYKSTIQYRIDYTDAAAKLGVSAEQIPELVSIVDADAEDNMLSVSAIYPTQEGAKIILDTVLEQVRAQKPAVLNGYGTYSLVVANEASAVVVDRELAAWSNENAQNIVALINSQKTLDKNLSGSTSAAARAMSSKEIAVNAFKYGAVGFAGGVAAGLMLLAIYLLAAGKVLSGREFNRHFGLAKIACVPGRKFTALKGPDKWAASIDSAYYNHPQRNVCLQVADASIRSAVRGDAQIALVGDLAQEYLEKLAAEMNKTGFSQGARTRYFAIPCLEQTPESVVSVRNCDAAVIVAKAEISTYKGAGDVLDMVDLLGREVIGSIVLM